MKRAHAPSTAVGPRRRLTWVAAVAAAIIWAGAEALEFAAGSLVGAGAAAAPVPKAVTPAPVGVSTEVLAAFQSEAASFRDDSPLSHAETEAVETLLEDLTSAAAATDSSEPFARTAVLQLDAQPRAYRGQPVEVAGVVRRAERGDDSGDDGDAAGWRLWLFADGRPCAVWARTLPEGFPIGEETATPATVRGVMVKRWAYRAVDAVRTAPLVAAVHIDWTPPAAPRPARDGTATGVIALGVATLAAAGAVAWLSLHLRRRKPPAPPPTDWSTLDQPPPSELEEAADSGGSP